MNAYPVPVRTRKTLSMRFKGWFEATGWYILLVIFALITAMPFFWTALMSVRETSSNIFSSRKPPELIPYPGTLGWGEGYNEAKKTGSYHVDDDDATAQQPAGRWEDYGPTWEKRFECSSLEEYVFPVTTQNYYRVWKDINIPRFFVNSVIVSVTAVLLSVLTCSLAAYPLAKMRFKGRSFAFSVILATLVFPPQLLFIPLYVMAVKVINFDNTYFALILPHATSAFGIFLLRQIYMGLPDELLEAARLDGASEFGIWWRILLPLIKPGLATLAIFTFVNAWNDFLWPTLMVQSDDMRTLPLGLTYLRGFFSGNIRAIAAGIVIMTVPMIVFFIAFQKQFVRGLSGAVKG
ncbi:MAG: carbohydrate ABC transporter permease [Chloroflexi bacterium]|nr:MAG: carbohydrate ABC transporter permease [Chloroflexota bacterium]